jgi:hypothetical protein
LTSSSPNRACDNGCSIILVTCCDRSALGDQRKNSYRIAVGKAGWETLVGDREAIDMPHHPAWEHPRTDEIITSGLWEINLQFKSE